MNLKGLLEQKKVGTFLMIIKKSMYINTSFKEYYTLKEVLEEMITCKVISINTETAFNLYTNTVCNTLATKVKKLTDRFKVNFEFILSFNTMENMDIEVTIVYDDLNKIIFVVTNKFKEEPITNLGDTFKDIGNVVRNSAYFIDKNKRVQDLGIYRINSKFMKYDLLKSIFELMKLEGIQTIGKFASDECATITHINRNKGVLKENEPLNKSGVPFLKRKTYKNLFKCIDSFYKDSKLNIHLFYNGLLTDSNKAIKMTVMQKNFDGTIDRSLYFEMYDKPAYNCLGISLWEIIGKVKSGYR